MNKWKSDNKTNVERFKWSNVKSSQVKNITKKSITQRLHLNLKYEENDSFHLKDLSLLLAGSPACILVLAIYLIIIIKNYFLFFPKYKWK